MIHFNRLLNTLSKEQRQLPQRYYPKKPELLSLNEQFQEVVKNILNDPQVDTSLSTTEIFPSTHQFSCLNAFLSLITIYPTDLEGLLGSLKEYLANFVIIFRPILSDFGLNANSLNYCLDSNLDHEHILLLLCLAFKVNLITVDSLGQCNVYSPCSLDRFYLIFYQDESFSYHGLRQQTGYQKDVKSSLHPNFAILLRSLNLFPPNHPLIVSLLEAAGQ